MYSSSSSSSLVLLLSLFNLIDSMSLSSCNWLMASFNCWTWECSVAIMSFSFNSSLIIEVKNLLLFLSRSSFFSSWQFSMLKTVSLVYWRMVEARNSWIRYIKMKVVTNVEEGDCENWETSFFHVIFIIFVGWSVSPQRIHWS